MKHTYILGIATLLSTSSFACSDFSGTWRGKCTDKLGKVSDSAGTFEQTGCEKVNEWEVGKTNKNVYPISEKELEVVTTPNWDAKQEALVVKGTSVLRIVETKKILATSDAVATFEIVHGQMKITSKGDATTYGEGAPTVKHEELTCLMDRE